MWSFPSPVTNDKQLVVIFGIIVQIHGHPGTIRPDNAPEFVAGEFKKWCEKQGISIKPISPHNPQANLAERPHSSLNKMISSVSSLEDDIVEIIRWSLGKEEFGEFRKNPFNCRFVKI